MWTAWRETCCRPLRSALSYGQFDDSAPRRFETQLKCTSLVILMAGGMLRALKVAKEEDASARPAHLVAQAQAAARSGDSEGAKELMWLADVLQTCQDQASHFQQGLASQVLTVRHTIMLCVHNAMCAHHNAMCAQAMCASATCVRGARVRNGVFAHGGV
jgi:hypothetical protein